MSGFSGIMPQDGRVQGFMLATVISNSDDKKKGTLKLKLLCEGEQSFSLEAVKMMSPYAGASYGAYILPEVGEQVVVGFLEGCIDRPFVLGSVYSASDAMLSDSFHKDNTKKRLKTKAGNLIEISDEKDAQSITIKTPKKLTVAMTEKDERVKITSGQTSLEIDGKNGKVTIKGEKELVLESGSAKLTLKSAGSVELKGTNVTVKGDSSLKLDSGGSLDIKGQKTTMAGSLTEVKADGILTLKGSLAKIN